MDGEEVIDLSPWVKTTTTEDDAQPSKIMLSLMAPLGTHSIVERCRNPDSRCVLIDDSVVWPDIIHEKLRTAWLMKAWRAHASSLSPAPRIVFDLRLPLHDVGDTNEKQSKMVWNRYAWEDERSFLLDWEQVSRAIMVIATGMKMRRQDEIAFEIAYGSGKNSWKQLQKLLSGFGHVSVTKLVKDGEVERTRPVAVRSESSASGMPSVQAVRLTKYMVPLSETHSTT
ncbi:hypothetical protein VHEMI05825 [[Torrubiella] hemipterigena]|uniref:Uncharacterized protein n=1 Tax=[Torrubiella] hemipterigena TaxID=1531966 RepID=A0A0A1T5C4_9HYPO|nr:hypothetical protein VHEMI05825 [[Torrubiella] hemipterigena]